MRRMRKLLAVLCVVALLFAVVVPGAAADLFQVVLIPLWLIAPAIDVVVIRRVATRFREQPASLLSLLPSRAPPARLALA